MLKGDENMYGVIMTIDKKLVVFRNKKRSSNLGRLRHNGVMAPYVIVIAEHSNYADDLMGPN